jgi:hypothetical protein
MRMSGGSDTAGSDLFRKYGNENCVLTAEFALGMPISVLDLILEGTEHFRKEMVL